MCLAISANIAPVYLTTFSEQFGGAGGLSEEELGRIPAVIFAFLVAGILVSGPLADRWGAKRFAMFGLALTCAGLGVLGLARSYDALLLSGAVMGFGAGVLDMVMSPIVSALQPHRRSSAMNWLHAFYCIGAVGTAAVCSAGIYLHVPWRVVAACLMALPAALFLGFVPQRIPALVDEDTERAPVAELFRRPYFWAAMAVIYMAGSTEVGMAQWLPAYAERSLGYSKGASGMALAAFSIAMVVGRLLAAAFGKHAKPIVLMVTCCVLLIALYLIGCYCPVSPIALAACVTVGLASSCLWPTTLGITADRIPHGGATMFALLAASGNIGCFVTPWIIGMVAERSQLNHGLSAVALCPLLMAVVLLGMRRGHASDTAMRCATEIPITTPVEQTGD